MQTRTIAILLFVLVMLVGCSSDKPESAANDAATTDTEMNHSEQGAEMADQFAMPNLDELEWQDGPEGLKYAIVREGVGTDINNGDRAQVHYSGWFKDNGQLFDSSRRKGVPFTFPVGGGQVIRGWDIGVEMMKVGGHWVFILPPELAYGERGYPGAIPPNSTLVFDVEVMNVE